MCPVYWLEKLYTFFPGLESDVLFSSKNYPHVTYSLFNKSLKRLICTSKIKDNFSTYSLRTGGGGGGRGGGGGGVGGGLLP